MKNSQYNPWENMVPGTQRRVKHDTNYDYFWIYDYERRYGFFIKLNIQEDINSDIMLRGIDIKAERTSDNCLEFYLSLEENEDWEIFYALCFDLVFVMDAHESDNVKISKLLERLEKWKNLLANKRQLNISREQQMGIFSELLCLHNIIAPNIGYGSAIEAWVGIEKDKQDFNMEKCVLEVKSHITTKGNVASISSLHQLTSEKDKLYLVSYGLTVNENGRTIDDLFDEIVYKLTSNEHEELMMKLFISGWIPHHDKLRKDKFIMDSEKLYKINELFPKINSNDIDPRVIEVKYKVDLSQCDEFECTTEELFGGE
ncbi:PD-(D/E)XK motif protein [Vallitalea guaymasensis]|uniref:PD-(D/E)XK motif protein n=1 Tax=Vallitalea guaymasensis TaxID=1185412 RepID=UPI002356C732|nr:PD-(D/E)XK motif protein [Vallitalea guaymasensis]